MLTIVKDLGIFLNKSTFEHLSTHLESWNFGVCLGLSYREAWKKDRRESLVFSSYPLEKALKKESLGDKR